MGLCYVSDMIDWSRCAVVESVPGKVSGAWVFKGTRLPIKALFDNLASGASIGEFLEWFDANEVQVRAVLEFVAAHSDRPQPDLATSEA